MTVHLYTVCWNEADILGFFFKHYDPWVDRYVIFDNGSTDGSIAMLRAHPKVEVRPFPWAHPDSFIQSLKRLHNEVWKESRGHADWVVITALDEHLQAAGRDNGEYLEASRRAGVTLIPAIGFQMISEEFPVEGEWLARKRTFGAPWKDMNKLSILDPNAIKETGFGRGRHAAKATGILRLPDRDEMMLLHYKFMGFEHTVKRHSELRGGLRTRDIAENRAPMYKLNRRRLRKVWRKFQARAVVVSDEKFAPSLVSLPSELWWRTEGWFDEPDAQA